MYIGGCNHSFRYVWLEEYPWRAYSEQVDGAFCIPCAIFCADSSKRATLLASHLAFGTKK